MVFTGDALFAGEVGRTDFYPDRKAEVAGELYDSLHKKILPLGDGVIVCPAHGGGSVCGAEISDLLWTTVATRRRQIPCSGWTGRLSSGRRSPSGTIIPPISHGWR